MSGNILRKQFASYFYFLRTFTYRKTNYFHIYKFNIPSAILKFSFKSVNGSFFRSRCMYLVPFLRYSASNNGMTLKSVLGVVQSHWKWYHSKAWCGFLFAFHSNYSSILYHFGERARYWRKIAIFTARCYAWRDYAVETCPSVCLSVRHTPVFYGNGLTYCHSYFSTWYSPIILVLWVSNIFAKFRRISTCVGTKYRLGIKISRFSISRYISQTIQDSAIVTTPCLKNCAFLFLLELRQISTNYNKFL